MSEIAEIEVGKTYEFHGWPEANEGRKALVLEAEGGLCKIRWPDGMARSMGANHLRGPVEAARPGIDEPCLLCDGTKEVEVKYNDPENPMLILSGGVEPCPNCGGR